MEAGRSMLAEGGSLGNNPVPPNAQQCAASHAFQPTCSLEIENKS